MAVRGAGRLSVLRAGGERGRAARSAACLPAGGASRGVTKYLCWFRFSFPPTLLLLLFWLLFFPYFCVLFVFLICFFSSSPKGTDVGAMRRTSEKSRAGRREPCSAVPHSSGRAVLGVLAENGQQRPGGQVSPARGGSAFAARGASAPGGRSHPPHSPGKPRAAALAAGWGERPAPMRGLGLVACSRHKRCSPLLSRLQVKA